MRKIVYVCALCLLTIAGRAQDEKQWFMDAEYFFMNDDFEKALPLYLKVYKADSTNCNVTYRIGTCYLKTPLKIFKALPFLEKATTNVSEQYKEGSFRERRSSIDAFYQLGLTYQTIHRYDDAMKAFTEYKNRLDVKDVFTIDKMDRRIASCRRAKDFEKKPRVVEIENIGNVINTAASEFNPCASDNDSVLIFTRVTDRLKDPKNQDVFIDNYRVMQTVKTGGTWAPVKEITAALKSDGRYKTISLSPNGKYLILYRDNYEVGSVKDIDFGALYMSTFENGAWTPISKLPPPINSTSEEASACISNDGKTLYFSSDRKSSHGGLDIYKSVKDANGNWSEPENLGKAINSPYDEESPFIVHDSLLYFSSEGHDNMGGKDVFYSKLTSNGWSTPVNMSVPVNSAGDDEFFVPTRGAKEAYYAVERHEGYLTFGKKDIYQIVLEPATEAPVPSKHDSVAVIEKKDTLVMVTGSIKRDDNTVSVTQLSVILINARTGKTDLEIAPDCERGTFAFKVLPGDYQLVVNDANYEKVTQNIFVPNDPSANLKLDILLVPRQVQSGEFLKIKSVYFDFGMSELTRDAMIELQRLIDLMKANPTLLVEVVGYTDSRGSSVYNKKLSLKRARGVVDYLVSKDIKPSRFVSKGMGEEQHVAVNLNADGSDNPDGRKLNRRVEMRILSQDSGPVHERGVSVPDKVKYPGKVSYTVVLARVGQKLAKAELQAMSKKGLGKIQVMHGDSVEIYYTGLYKDKASAMAMLNKALELGYDKAEIVDNFELKQAETVKPEHSGEKNTKYVIQLSAQFKPCDIASAFKKLKGVSEVLGSEGLYKYYYGYFSTIQDARAECAKLRDAGYVDAFVTNCSELEANNKKLTPGVIYTIQIHASYNRITPNTFGDLKGVEEKFKQDGLYRYIYGRYSSWEQAHGALDSIKKRGFNGAFISTMRRFE